MKLNLLITALVLLHGSVFALPDNPLEHKLVRVRATYQTWNEYRPWLKNKPRNRTFLGTVLPGNRILVEAYYLTDTTLIQVEKYDRPPRVPARVLHVDFQADLAIITVDEPGFFDDLKPVELAENTAGEDFYCAAWKSGQLTIASCRWSQVTVFNSLIPAFAYAGIYFITDLKGGGRGEPVFSGNRMVGMTRSQSKDRITVIPAEIIQAYLKATEMPKYPGFGKLGIAYQYNQGKAQAAYFGQTGKPSGIRILKCIPGGSAEGILQPDDILLELDGHAINSQGDYMHSRYGLLELRLIATEGHYVGDVISAKVLRNKEELTFNIPLKNIPPSNALIPKARPNSPPPYLIAGGFVFRELDVPYLKAWGNEWKKNIPAELRILNELKNESQTPEQQRLIVLADVFPDEYNLGYHDMAQNIVKAVNGHPIDSIREMEEAFQHPKEGFHVIEFMPSYGTQKVILDADQFESATKSIMEKYQIPYRIRLNP